MSLVTWMEERVSRVWVGVAGLVLIAIQAWLNFRGDAPPFVAVYALLPGLAFLVAALILWGTHRISVFLALVGFAWIFGGLGGSTVSTLLNAVTLWFGDLWRVVLAHTALAYPEGRLRDGLARRVVWIGYAFIAVGGLVRTLAFAPYEWQSCECPRNAFAIFHSQRLFDGIDLVYGIIGAVLELVIIVLLVRFYRGSPNEQRRLHAPLLVTAGAFALLLVVELFTRAIDVSQDVNDWLFFFVHLGLVAAAISYPLALRRERKSTARIETATAPS
jgi:F0F1-type ATP synthase assembly protein I